MNPPTAATATIALLRETAKDPSSLGRVASYLSESPSTHATETIGHIAEVTGTSPATVTRLAGRLGLGGYKELRVVLAAAGSDPLSDAVLPGISWSDSPEDLLQKLASQERRTLKESARLIDAAALTTCAALIASAHRVMVFGVGASRLVGMDLASKLDRIGVISHVSPDRHDALALGAAFTDKDAVVLISNSGTTIDVLEVARALRTHTPTACLVSRSKSMLADLCDPVLRTSPGPEQDIRPGATSSRIGQMFACDALSIAVMQAHPARSRTLLAATRSSVETLH